MPEQARQQAGHRVRIDVLLLEPVHRDRADQDRDAQRHPAQPVQQVAARVDRRLSLGRDAGVGRRVGGLAHARNRADRIQGFAMPTVSGETLALPPLNSSQALACTAGNTAFCAASPDSGVEQGAAAVGVFLQRLALGDVLGPDLLQGLHHFVGHALGNEDAEVVGRRGEARQRLRQRRNRAVAFQFQRLVADGGQRTQALAADHVGLFDGQLRRDVGLAGDGRDDGGVAAVIRHVAVLHAGDLGRSAPSRCGRPK